MKTSWKKIPFTVNLSERPEQKCSNIGDSSSDELFFDDPVTFKFMNKYLDERKFP